MGLDKDLFVKQFFSYRIIMLIAFVLGSCSGLISQEKKILFLGNSYTAVNNLPSLLEGLAISGGHDIYVDMNTPGGYTLAFPSNGHLYNQNSLDKIAEEDWDYVVLQEQSQFPTIDFYHNNYTFPGAVQLDLIIRQNNECSKTLFYMTWGRKYGGEQCIDNHCSVDFINYAHMQDSLASSYLSMSNYLQTPVCPAGLTWKKSIVLNGDPIELFAGDGSHPSLAGSYLNACAFYASIFHSSPLGLSFTAGLDESEAEYLQQIAGEVVLNNLQLWNIDTTTVVAAFNYNQNGGEVIFENLSLNANQYLWDFGNGDTDTTSNPTYTYYEAGIYNISLLSYSECKEDIIMQNVEVVISDINNHDLIPMVVYPSPVKDYLTVEFETSSINSSMEMIISDIFGVTHKSAKLDIINPIKINTSSLTNGIYIISIMSDNSMVSASKFIVNH